MFTNIINDTGVVPSTPSLKLDSHEDILQVLDQISMKCDRYVEAQVTNESLSMFAHKTLISIVQVIQRIMNGVKEFILNTPTSELNNYYKNNQMIIKDIHDQTDKFKDSIVPSPTGLRREYIKTCQLIVGGFNMLEIESSNRTVSQELDGMYREILRGGSIEKYSRFYQNMVNKNTALNKRFVKPLRDSYDNRISFKSKTSQPFTKLFKRSEHLKESFDSALSWEGHVLQANAVNSQLTALDKSTSQFIDAIHTSDNKVNISLKDIKLLSKIIRSVAVYYEYYGVIAKEACKLEHGMVEIYTYIARDM